MSIIWPGALRWTLTASSAPTRCSIAPRLDNLFTRIVPALRNSHSTFSSPSLYIKQPLSARSTRPICPSTSPKGLAFPNRKFRITPDQESPPAPIIREYENLPPDYEDKVGLSFRSHELSQKEVMQWFGPGVDTQDANIALRILHGRRVAGTLDDPKYSDFPLVQEKLQQDGLAWLRKNVPVDEIRNAGVRAEEELAEMDAELIADGDENNGTLDISQPKADPNLVARSEKLGLYKAQDEDASIYLPNAQPTDSYPESALDNIRRINEERYAARLAEEEEARKKQEEEMRETNGDLTVTNLGDEMKSRVELQRPERQPSPWLIYYQEKAASVVPPEVPDMTKTKRLLPSGLFTLFTVMGCMLFATFYVPPTHRLMTELPPAAATIMGIVIINALFLLAWRLPPLWSFMNCYMMVVPGYPRAAAMLGSVFSHQSFQHYGANMLVLWFVGSKLADQIGRGDFMALYISLGVLAAYISMFSYVMRGIYVTSHLGASGAVSGIVGAFCWINRDQELNIAFLPPEMASPLPEYSSLVLLAIAILLEVRYIVKRRRAGTKEITDHINHLAGYGAGIVGGELVRRRMAARRREKAGILMMKNREVLG